MCVCSGIYTNFNVFIVQTWKLDLLVTEMGKILEQILKGAKTNTKLIVKFEYPLKSSRWLAYVYLPRVYHENRWYLNRNPGTFSNPKRYVKYISQQNIEWVSSILQPTNIKLDQRWSKSGSDLLNKISDSSHMDGKKRSLGGETLLNVVSQVPR